MASSRAMRSSVEGWVENSRVKPPLERIEDEHVRGGGRGVGHGHAFDAGFEFSQRRD